MVFIVVCLFNSIRATAVICLAVPLAIIGATAGLLITNNPFGFMALLGLLALGGEQIKNSIVLVEEIYIQIDEGKEPYPAILQAGVSRLRPVLLVVVTTVLGMIPLLLDPFFAGDGRGHHVWTGLCRCSDHDRRAGALRDLLSRPRGLAGAGISLEDTALSYEDLDVNRKSDRCIQSLLV